MMDIDYQTVFSLENDQGIGGGCGLQSISKNIGHSHCHIKEFWMQKLWGPPTLKEPRENTVSVFSPNTHTFPAYQSGGVSLLVNNGQ